MPSMKDVFAASAIAFFATSSAHMILNHPRPYGSPNNSPLDPSGSDFPCKSISNIGAPFTDMPVGSTQQLSFNGSAVHGGGSCQVALTKDNPATKTSKWMVIHSIEGGCPSKTASGNLGSAPSSTSLADTYDFKIPAGIAPSSYTLAWTWFNKIGNREMYMNCANVKVTGGSAKRNVYNNQTYTVPALSSRDTTFPDLFTANIAGSPCKTKTGVSVAFPSPGTSTSHFGSDKAVPAECGGSAGGAGTGAGASANVPAPETAASGADAAPAALSPGAAGSESGAAGAAPAGENTAPTSASSAPSSPLSPKGGVDSKANASGSSPGEAPTPATSSGASASENSSSGILPSANTAASNAAAPGPAAPVTAASTTSVTCGNPGQSVCSPDSKMIGTCDASLKAVMISTPQGTVCKAGTIQWPRRKRASGFFA